MPVSVRSRAEFGSRLVCSADIYSSLFLECFKFFCVLKKLEKLSPGNFYPFEFIKSSEFCVKRRVEKKRPRDAIAFVSFNAMPGTLSNSMSKVLEHATKVDDQSSFNRRNWVPLAFIFSFQAASLILIKQSNEAFVEMAFDSPLAFWRFVIIISMQAANWITCELIAQASFFQVKNFLKPGLKVFKNQILYK